MAECHLRAIEVEEVHQLNGATFLQGAIVDASRFVIEFDIYGEDLHVF
jgi:hypothetical protein